MLGNIRGPEIFAILIIVVLLFGVGRISKVSGEIGSAIRNFREGLKGDASHEKTVDSEKKSD